MESIIPKTSIIQKYSIDIKLLKKIESEALSCVGNNYAGDPVILNAAYLLEQLLQKHKDIWESVGAVDLTLRHSNRKIFVRSWTGSSRENAIYSAVCFLYGVSNKRILFKKIVDWMAWNTNYLAKHEQSNDFEEENEDLQELLKNKEENAC